MRSFFCILMTVFALGSAAAQGFQPHPMRGPRGEWSLESQPYQAAEFKTIESELGDVKWGDLTMNQLTPYLNRLNVAKQKDERVERARWQSTFLPGLGQLQNDDLRTGFLFLATHIVIVAGTLTFTYMTLPAGLKFDQLNYVTSSFGTVRDNWERHSLSDLLPALGILVGGFATDGVLVVFAREGAAGSAHRAIDDGKVTFEPQVTPDGFAFGFHY